MNIFNQNKLNIEKRISLGLGLMRQNYELIEIETGDFKTLQIQSMNYTVEQYEVRGVGNLLVMVCKEPSVLQMDSFVITPYYKNLPLFSTDYMYMKEKRTFLNEIYSLVAYEDDLYKKYIEAFNKISERYKYLPDMLVKSCWYDEIRPVCIAKNTDIKEDDEIIKLFMKNLEIFIRMEKESPNLTWQQYKVKWQKTQDYAEDLVDRGGISTDVFKAVLGEVQTKKFFNEVFFAPALYEK